MYEYYMFHPPANAEEKYIFIVEDERLALVLSSSGCRSVLLTDDQSIYFSEDDFFQYMEEIELNGSCQADYRYIFYGSKRLFERINAFCSKHCLICCNAWPLFHKKDYLWLNPDTDDSKLKELIAGFIQQCEGPGMQETGLDRFHFLNEKGEPCGVFDIEIVDDIVSQLPFFVIDGIPFIYRHGVYVQDKDGVLLFEEIRKRLYRRFIRSSTIKRVYQLLITVSSVQKSSTDLNNYPRHWINFRNGFYDPIEKRMIDHQPEYLSVNQIPFEYDLSAEALNSEVIEQFLSTSLPDPEEQQMLWEYLGYCMTTDTQFQKFLMLIGEGATGKSVIIHLFETVIGIQNRASISLQDLNHRFYATGLYGKLLNSCGDIPCRSMETIDVVKKAVGEDTLIYEKKGHDATQFKSYAKLLFSSNGMPENLEDRSNALYRRLMILEMNHTVSSEERDVHLKAKIEKEIDYAIHKAMAALSVLYERGHLTESENSKRCVERARQASDSTKAFIDSCLTEKPGSSIERSRMYALYQDYCTDDGRHPLGKTKFFRELERKGLSPVKIQGIYQYRNMTLRSEEFDEIDDLDDEEFPF